MKAKDLIETAFRDLNPTLRLFTSAARGVFIRGIRGGGSEDLREEERYGSDQLWRRLS
jgi:hypothetical protein